MVGFDSRESDLPLRIAFPLLIANSLQWFAGRDRDQLTSSFATGHHWSIPLQDVTSSTRYVWVQGPNGSRFRAPLQDGKALLRGSHVGIYELRYGKQKARIAANLASASESGVSAHPELKIRGKRVPQPPPATSLTRVRPWALLLAAALALTLAEWASSSGPCWWNCSFDSRIPILV